MAPPGLDTVKGSRSLDSTLLRGAGGSRLLLWDNTSSDLGLLQARGRWCALFEMYACLNVCVCVYSVACIGWQPLFSSWAKHFLRISSDSLPSADCVQFDSGLPHFEAGVGVTADFPVNWSQYQRPWRVNEDSQSLKAPSWRRSPSCDACHLKVVRAEATTSPHLRPLSSVSATQKVNPSSNSKLNFIAACVMLKKITWSCHKHQPGVKSNSVSSAQHMYFPTDVSE